MATLPPALSIPARSGGWLFFRVNDDEPTDSLWVELGQSVRGKRDKFKGECYDPTLNRWRVWLPGTYTFPRRGKPYSLIICIANALTPADELLSLSLSFVTNSGTPMEALLTPASDGIVVNIVRFWPGQTATTILPVGLLARPSFITALRVRIKGPTFVWVDTDESVQSVNTLYQKTDDSLRQIALISNLGLPVGGLEGNAKLVTPGTAANPLASAQSQRDLFAYAKDHFGFVYVAQDESYPDQKESLYIVNRGLIAEVKTKKFVLATTTALPALPVVNTLNWPPVAKTFEDMLAYPSEEIAEIIGVAKDSNQAGEIDTLYLRTQTGLFIIETINSLIK